MEALIGNDQADALQSDVQPVDQSNPYKIPQSLLKLSVPRGCVVMFVRACPETDVLAFVTTNAKTDRAGLMKYNSELYSCGAVPVHVYGIATPPKTR